MHVKSQASSGASHLHQARRKFGPKDSGSEALLACRPVSQSVIPRPIGLILDRNNISVQHCAVSLRSEHSEVCFEEMPNKKGHLDLSVEKKSCAGDSRLFCAPRSLPGVIFGPDFSECISNASITYNPLGMKPEQMMVLAGLLFNVSSQKEILDLIKQYSGSLLTAANSNAMARALINEFCPGEGFARYSGIQGGLRNHSGGEVSFYPGIDGNVDVSKALIACLYPQAPESHASATLDVTSFIVLPICMVTLLLLTSYCVYLRYQARSTLKQSSRSNIGPGNICSVQVLELGPNFKGNT